MTNPRPSASLVPLALALVILAASPAAAGPLALRSVGEIFVDAQGLAQGQNVAGRLAPAEGAIEAFQAVGIGSTVFDEVRIEGFAPGERVEGIGSSALVLRGQNARILLHDNLHSVLEVEATQPLTLAYRLAEGVSATQEGAHGASVRLTKAGETIGHLVAVGAEGPRTRGEAIVVRGSDITARLQSGSEMVFLAKARSVTAPGYHDAVVTALAQGALASQYVTEFEGSAIATSEIATGEDATARTLAGGAIGTTLAARRGPSLVVYELAYETLPARSADDVAVYLDGELARRVDAPQDALADARDGLPGYFAASEGGRTQVIAALATPGEHRIVVAVGAHASTEPQGRAEREADDDARVYGAFERHANGKLTGEFLSGVLPEGHAILLGLTALSTRTEVFRNVSVDGGAAASFHGGSDDEMRIETAKADLALVDDAHATMVLRAKAPASARFELASGVVARPVGERILALDGPHGPAGALILLGDGGALALGAGGVVDARLDAGGALLYRASPDEHASEPAVQRAIADGRVGAQLLAGIHEGALVAKATAFTSDAHATIAAAGGALDITYLAAGDAGSAFALDVRGGALAAREADDVRVVLDGVALDAAASLDEALASAEPRYHATTSAEGALRIVVATSAAAGERVDVRIESAIEGLARERANADAFGAFRLFSDGSAVGDFVTLKADRASGAVTGLATLARGEPLFTSLVAGRSPYVHVVGDGTSVLTLQNAEARIEVADSTNAFTKVVALAPTDAAFRLAAGLRAEQRGEGVVGIVAADGAHVGSLVASRAALLAVRAEGDVRASLATGGELVFRTHEGIEGELSAAQRGMMDRAIAGGRVAGQVTIQATGAATTTATVAYDDVEILTQATRERVEITIDSAAEAGKTLIVSLDPRTVPGMASGRATIRFDGALAHQASSYADILDPTDDGPDRAEYFVLAGEAGTQVLVSIPHFSVHVVTLEQDARGSDTWLVVATILLGLIVIAQSVLLARKARASKHVNIERRP